MTKLLERAITKVRVLPSAGQDAIAALIFEELEDQRRWDEAFARTPGKLERLAARARKDIRKGRVKEMGMDEL